ncbi:amino acid transporter [Pseudomonas sp. P155]|uniref:Amino acid transporter n=1 Tax=Pseudomonas neuropathica TaxID=2730425 RepID=A0ABS0BMM9_9PSED|nr:amino acid transporter [Pseudomonas neuropathica]MBF6034933.1 amino acid transporter [Pseudomonas neuropathica]
MTTARPLVPDQEQWQPWTPDELARRLSAVNRPWCVVGGWALDLWHGRQTRTHSDLEFTVLRADFACFRQALSDLDFYAVKDGTFQLLSAICLPAADIFQVWGYDRAAQAWRVDVMIEPGTPDTWVYKRDPSIVCSRADMVMRSTAGIPYLRPAAVLLFKAKHTRAKDRSDFAMALPRMSVQERVWLVRHLTLLHPEHDWLDAVQALSAPPTAQG